MAQVVNRNRVLAASIPTNYEAKQMVKVLSKQGQIEPLQVKVSGENFVTFDEDCWAPAILEAAKRLEWPTILVVVMLRYEH